MSKQATAGISQRELARRWGVRHSYVQQLIKRGVIPTLKGTRGRVDPVAADAARARSRERAPRMSPVASPSEPGRPGPTGGSNPYIQARTVHETYRAKKEKLEYERLTGKLVESDKVLEAAEKAFSNVRVRLRGLAKGMAPILAANSHPAEIEKMLSDAIDGCLEGLASDVFKE